MDDAELLELAEAIRLDNPALSIEQALDVAAVEREKLAAYTLVWDAQPTNVTTDISAYEANWDRDSARLAALAIRP